MNKLPLSLVIIAYNEEKNIARCISSAPFASEVIVVDSKSTDKTVEEANKYYAKVYQKEFLGFREQKQFAHNLATLPWVLSLDADEALSDDLRNEIFNLFKNPHKYDGYKIPRLSFYLGRWIKHGGWYPDYQLRLYKKELATWVGGGVHEKVVVKGNVGVLKKDIHHYVFSNLSEQIKTNNRYSTEGALELNKNSKKFSLLKLIFKPFGKFIECYFYKFGFLDGAAGFIIALGASQSMFLKYAKLWEIENFDAIHNPWQKR
ncbi:MAG: glycosyltransferase family 2 protein [Oligoflexia bacterium]|nr:glycosyltransferase family 2 protein [Oligoflexia bacterium]